jgi:hypothetical protein
MKLLSKARLLKQEAGCDIPAAFAAEIWHFCPERRLDGSYI